MQHVLVLLYALLAIASWREDMYNVKPARHLHPMILEPVSTVMSEI